MNGRKFHDRSAVCKSSERNLDAGCGERLIEFVEFCFLLMGIGLVKGICRGHMREHSLDFEIIQSGDFLDIFYRKVYIVCEVADSAHSGIHSDESVYRFSGFFSFRRECCRIFAAANHWSDIVLYDGVCVHIWSQPQHDDFFLCAGFAQGYCLLQGCDCKGFAAVCSENFGNLYAAVTVSVGLDDTDHFPSCDFILNLFNVVIQV